jgi:hypothetical protein
MSKGGGGDAPDTVGAAKETGKQARMLNESQTYANRPNQSNAWGQTSWANAPSWDESTGQYINKWTQTEKLNPKLQGSLDAQQNVQSGRSNLAQGQMARVWDDQSKAMDFDQYGDPLALGQQAPVQYSGWDADQNPIQQSGWNAFDQAQGGFDYDVGGQRQSAEDAAYQKATNRLDPQFDSQRGELETRLRNQGLQQGDVAYDNSISNFDTGRNDAYEQARLGASAEGRTESDLGYRQQLGQYGANQGANQQVYDQYMGGIGADNAAQQQRYGQYMGGQQFDNQAQQQQFGQNVQQNEIANSLRTQGVEEDLFKRGFSLDEVNRMLSGQQIAGGPPSSGGETETVVGKTLGGG